jgi:hypothetical protein
LTVQDEEIGGSHNWEYEEDWVVLFEEKRVSEDEVDFKGDGEKQ